MNNKKLSRKTINRITDIIVIIVENHFQDLHHFAFTFIHIQVKNHLNVIIRDAEEVLVCIVICVDIYVSIFTLQTTRRNNYHATIIIVV